MNGDSPSTLQHAAGVAHLLIGMDVDENFLPLPNDDEGVVSDHVENVDRHCSNELQGVCSVDAAADCGESCKTPPAPAAQRSLPQSVKKVVSTAENITAPLTGISGSNPGAHVESSSNSALENLLCTPTDTEEEVMRFVG